MASTFGPPRSTEPVVKFLRCRKVDVICFRRMLWVTMESSAGIEGSVERIPWKKVGLVDRNLVIWLSDADVCFNSYLQEDM